MREAVAHMLYKICVLKILAKLTEKTPVLESLFNKGVCMRPSTLLKTQSSAGVFMGNFLKKIKTTA